VASHTPRLAAASSEFRKILDQIPTKLASDSNVRLFSGIDGSPVVNISAGLNKLAKQISHTVQWAHCLEGCVEAGASVFFELGLAGHSMKWPPALIPISRLVAWKTSERYKACVRGSRASSTELYAASCWNWLSLKTID
jgi:hypothetical protein